LHRCLQRYGISRLPDIEDGKGIKPKFKTYPIGYFHTDIAEVSTAQGRLLPLRCHRSHLEVRLHRDAREGQAAGRS